MASLLRQIVAGPRAKHAETGLDLCYVTSNIIATSGPSQTYPQRAYRNPLDRLVAFLDARHGDHWAIWEFRAEGTGYPDAAVYDRIRHYPWPDHHPPPFRLVPLILASMRQWLGADCEGPLDDGVANTKTDDKEAKKDKAAQTHRVVVVHCKAGKGRSGTMACSYLVAECGWTPEQALSRFTARRMRPGFGSGVTIPSQRRWLRYVNRWAHAHPPNDNNNNNNNTTTTTTTTANKRTYVDRPVEIVAVHVRGLRHGVKLSVEGYVDEGKKIRVFHTFTNDERTVVEADAPGGGGLLDFVSDLAGLTVAGDGGDNDLLGTDSKKSTALGRPRTDGALADATKEERRRSGSSPPPDKSKSTPALTTPATPSSASLSSSSGRTCNNNKQTWFASADEPGGRTVIFRPKTPVRVPTSDVNIAIERRNRTPTSLAGLAFVTSVAHVWFNAFFEGNGPEQGGAADDHGVFAVDWDELDGIKGSSQKGSRAADRLVVEWRAVQEEHVAEAETVAEAVSAGAGGGGGAQTEISGVPVAPEDLVSAAGPEGVPQMRPADWRGGNQEDPEAHKRLGLRTDDPESVDVSRASSVQGVPTGGGDSGSGPSASLAAAAEKATAATGTAGTNDSDDTLAAVKTSGPTGEELTSNGDDEGHSVNDNNHGDNGTGGGR
ncbi:phosphatidylinositol-trisphosphate 3-phosphatase pten [Niveomyces insectorum RCEF 264]|uniref:phosphatidylinositol-3,4,5-trisphosphate 3-phosphatase n=1 Tax=Niveomyces insectorum RCEF 264 TaxID=1081102 RepID=A0A167YXL4_9HYPO|nr:phosphatidylinositol-trisphosphate 3-phosphatase pten [Niveomyces insectorum RCEF 264]